MGYIHLGVVVLCAYVIVCLDRKKRCQQKWLEDKSWLTQWQRVVPSWRWLYSTKQAFNTPFDSKRTNKDVKWKSQQPCAFAMDLFLQQKLNRQVLIYFGELWTVFFIRVYGKKISVTNCSQCQRDRSAQMEPKMANCPPPPPMCVFNIGILREDSTSVNRWVILLQIYSTTNRITFYQNYDIMILSYCCWKKSCTNGYIG